MSTVLGSQGGARPPPPHADCRVRVPATLFLCPCCRVVQLEAQRLEETREDREQFLRSLREELERQAAQKGVKLSLPAHSARDAGS